MLIVAEIVTRTQAMKFFVAKGTYEEEVILRPGISLRGGYSVSSEATNIDWSRDISANTTTIKASGDTAIKGGSSITTDYTDTTVVEGFTIEGGNLSGVKNYGVFLAGASPTITKNSITTGGDTEPTAVSILNSCSPKIDTNTITGGSGTLKAFGVYSGSSSTAIISNNTIYGGSAGSDSYGIYIAASSMPSVSNNFIYGGLTGTTTAIYNQSSPTISNNNIYGGAGSSPRGIYCLSGSPEIIGNTIDGGGSDGLQSHAIRSCGGKVINNIITGGNSQTSFAIRHGTKSPLIFNNVIDGGSGRSSSRGIEGSSGSPQISNNIIFNTGRGTRYSIYESGASAEPAALKNNNLFDAGTGGTYVIYRANSSCNGGGANCASLADMESDLGAAIATGNVSINNASSQLFVNAVPEIDSTHDGPDGNSTYDGSTTTIETPSCLGGRYVVNEYFEYNNDGVARKISSTDCSGSSSIITFSPALSSTSETGKRIHLWKSNSSNLTESYQLQSATATICNVVFGGIDLSSNFTNDKDSATRSASLPGGSPCTTSNTGAVGWSMGAYEGQ